MATLLLKNQETNHFLIAEELESTKMELEAERVLTRKGRKDTYETAQSFRSLQHLEVALEQLFKQATGEFYVRPPEPSASLRSALVEVYNDMGGPRWRCRKGWEGRWASQVRKGIAPLTSHPWIWHGVGYRKQWPQVTSLILPDNGLSGKLSLEWLNKTPELEELDFSENALSGSISGVVRVATALQVFRISRACLQGSIPWELTQLTKLVEIDLTHNQLSGCIPVSFCHLVKLRTLRLSGNQISGTLPHLTLPLLRTLDVRDNCLEGSIPHMLSSMKELRRLDLSCNRFSGPFPQWLSELTSLRQLHLNHNRLEGPLPRTWNGLGNLELFYANSNHIDGTLPYDLGVACTSLRALVLCDNELTGPVPSSFANLSNLFTLVLDGNYLHGPLPPGLGKLQKLLDFSIMEGEESRNLGVPRRFLMSEFELLWRCGPRMGLNNTTYPVSRKCVDELRALQEAKEKSDKSELWSLREARQRQKRKHSISAEH